MLVEGQTEEAFVTRVLRPHLWDLGVQVSSTMVVTSTRGGRRTFRGGVTAYVRLREDVRRLLASNPVAVTTMFDVYRFPADMPGYPDPWPATAAQRHGALTAAMEDDIADTRFFAGLVAHEFEGLLFSGPAVLARAIEPDAAKRATLQRELQKVRDAHPTPEDINDGPESAPSKRLMALCAYDKVLHGPEAAQGITLAGIRASCPLFNAWVTRLEQLGA